MGKGKVKRKVQETGLPLAANPGAFTCIWVPLISDGAQGVQGKGAG